jgi:hypothetical protein
MLMIKTVFKRLWLSCRKVKIIRMNALFVMLSVEFGEIFMVSTRDIPLGSYCVD